MRKEKLVAIVTVAALVVAFISGIFLAVHPEVMALMMIHKLSLRFPKGTIVGIHGASGCGKSTLLKLLMRFWDAAGGHRV